MGWSCSFFDSTQTLEWDRFTANWCFRYYQCCMKVLIRCNFIILSRKNYQPKTLCLKNVSVQVKIQIIWIYWYDSFIYVNISIDTNMFHLYFRNSPYLYKYDTIKFISFNSCSRKFRNIYKNLSVWFLQIFLGANCVILCLLYLLFLLKKFNSGK